MTSRAEARGHVLDEALAEAKGADERAKKAVADVSSWMITAAI